MKTWTIEHLFPKKKSFPFHYVQFTWLKVMNRLNNGGVLMKLWNESVQKHMLIRKNCLNEAYQMLMLTIKHTKKVVTEKIFFYSLFLNFLSNKPCIESGQRLVLVSFCCLTLFWSLCSLAWVVASETWDQMTRSFCLEYNAQCCQYSFAMARDSCISGQFTMWDPRKLGEKFLGVRVICEQTVETRHVFLCDYLTILNLGI